MPDLAAHKAAERLTFLCRSTTQIVKWMLLVNNAFPRLWESHEAEAKRRPHGESRFLSECRWALRKLPEFSDCSWPRRALYREIVEGAESDPLVERLGLSLVEVRSQWRWAPGSGFLSNSEFSLTWRLARNALPLANVLYKADSAAMPFCTRCDSGLDETAKHAFFYCSKVHPLWKYVNEVTSRIAPDMLIPLDVSYVVDNVSPPFSGEKRKVFFAELAVARMVIWTTRLRGLYGKQSFSCHDLIVYFRHQLRVKIRSDKQRLDSITFRKRWVHAASLCVRTGAGLETLLPSSHGHYGPD